MQGCLLLDVLYDQVFDLYQNTDTDIDQACTIQGERGRSITRKQFGDASMIYRDGYFMTSLFLLVESMMTLGTSAPRPDNYSKNIMRFSKHTHDTLRVHN